MPGARRWRARPAFLGALPEEARRRAVITFGDKERFNWHYVPRGREGLPFKAMPAPARAAAHELMKASLSRGRLRQGHQRDPSRGRCCASSRRSAGSCVIPRTTRSPCSARRIHRGAVGLAPRRPSSVAQLHPRARQARRGHAGLLRRQSGRGALGPPEGPAHPRRASRIWAERWPRAWTRRSAGA